MTNIFQNVGQTSSPIAPSGQQLASLCRFCRSEASESSQRCSVRYGHVVMIMRVACSHWSLLKMRAYSWGTDREAFFMPFFYDWKWSRRPRPWLVASEHHVAPSNRHGLIWWEGMTNTEPQGLANPVAQMTCYAYSIKLMYRVYRSKVTNWHVETSCWLYVNPHQKNMRPGRCPRSKMYLEQLRSMHSKESTSLSIYYRTWKTTLPQNTHKSFSTSLWHVYMFWAAVKLVPLAVHASSKMFGRCCGLQHYRLCDNEKQECLKPKLPWTALEISHYSPPSVPESHGLLLFFWRNCLREVSTRAKRIHWPQKYCFSNLWSVTTISTKTSHNAHRRPLKAQPAKPP